MIVFQGNISKECEKFVCKKERMKAGKLTSVVSAIFAIPTIIIALNWELIVFLFLVPLALFPLFMMLPLTKGAKESIFATRIQIDGKIMSCKGKRFNLEYYTKDVKQVTDYGDWYIIDFYYPNKNSHFVCQKNLIIEGSIEDFENLFSEKIIIKNKRN